HRIPKIRVPSPQPARLCPSPYQPYSQADTAIPAKRYGNTSQFGMRRLRRSVNVATASTATVGHQAINCINPSPNFCSLYEMPRCEYAANTPASSGGMTNQYTN